MSVELIDLRGPILGGSGTRNRGTERISREEDEPRDHEAIEAIEASPLSIHLSLSFYWPRLYP